MPEEVNETPTESIEEVSTPTETAEGGSPHFAIGDDPPHDPVLNAEPEARATESEGGVGQEEVEGAEAAPMDPFFSFKTADGTVKDFDSREQAQQFFSSWNGRLSKAEKELNEATAYNQQWQDAYKNGQLGGQQTQPGTQAKDSRKPAAEESFSALAPADLANIEKLLKDGDGVKAIQYLNWRNGEFLKEQVEGLRAELGGRIEQVQAPAKFQEEVAEAMTFVAEQGVAAVNDMGEPLYPEFQEGTDTYDHPFVQHFRDIWLGQDYQLATNPDGSGFDAAYYKARATFTPGEAEASNGQSEAEKASSPLSPAEAVTSAAQNVPRNADGTFAKRNAALAMSDTGTPGANRRVASGKRKTDILDAMRDVGKPRSPHFSVSPD